MNENKKFLSGNEAIAHGAFKAGCKLAAAYPGTPSTEILENVSKFKDSIYCEWSVNEKVAMEVAIGASIVGARALTAMKHVGLNVAADPLMTVSYIGANGGLVIVSADDPGMHSSQNEQDNRNYAKFAKIALLEPADSQEAYDMTIKAFEISEEFDTPVILRVTTRTSHSSGIVDLGDFTPLPSAGKTYEKNVEKNVPVPLYARRMRVRVEDRLNKLREYAEISPLNRIEAGSKEIGIITSGVAYQYVKEVFPEASILKLGFTNPIPRRLIAEFAASVDRLYVVEELDPFLEEQVRALGIKVQDKDEGLHIGELNPVRLKKLRAEIMGEPVPVIATKGAAEGLPARPPVLCAGCGHRSVFYALNRLKATVTGDIGCYSLGMFKPLDAMDTVVCMGASVGKALGMEKAGYPGKVAAVLGDSTFFHSGMTGLLDIVYNRGVSTVIVLDNRITAMTGHQDNPGTGRTLMGESTKEISIEQIAKGLGVERVRVIDCYDMEEVQRVLEEELNAPEPSVVVAKKPCALYTKLAGKRQFAIDFDKCKGCRACLKIGCPALELGDADPEKPKIRKVQINPVLCAGCGMCLQVCKYGAISEVVSEYR
ncbi:MAG TPA: indolepyruvate ferredoxin oxidoreductase subunit alpha [Armatimonadota bacterium]